MLNQCTIDAATPIVDRINAAGIELAAMPNTILDVVCTSAYSPVLDNGYDNTNWLPEWLASIDRLQVFGNNAPFTYTDEKGEVTFIPVSQHDATLNEATKIITNAVIAAIGRARNEHKPLIASFIEDINKDLAIEQAVIEPYEIVDIAFNPIWENYIIQKAMESYSRGNRFTAVTRAEIPSIPVVEKLDSYISNSNAALDKAYSECLQEAGLTSQQVWESIFSGRGSIGSEADASWSKRNLVMCQFLMCSGLLNNPVPGSGLSLTAWETLMRKLCIALANLANFIWKAEKQAIEFNVLVRDFDAKSGTVYLNREVYNKFLEQGGAPELIYGAILGKSYKDLNFGTLLSEKDKLIRQWNAYHASVQFQKEQQYTARVKEVLVKNLINATLTIKDDILPPNTTVVALQKRAKDVVGKIQLYSTKNISELAMKVFCEVLLPHTPTYFILAHINEQLAQSPDITAEEAASNTMIEYIADWIASAIIITHNPSDR